MSILLIFKICDDIPWLPWQQLVIQYDFLTSFIWGYLHTKLKVSSISLSRDIELFGALKTPSQNRVNNIMFNVKICYDVIFPY